MKYVMCSKDDYGDINYHRIFAGGGGGGGVEVAYGATPPRGI